MAAVPHGPTIPGDAAYSSVRMAVERVSLMADQASFRRESGSVSASESSNEARLRMTLARFAGDIEIMNDEL